MKKLLLLVLFVFLSFPFLLVLFSFLFLFCVFLFLSVLSPLSVVWQGKGVVAAHDSCAPENLKTSLNPEQAHLYVQSREPHWLVQTSPAGVPATPV